MPEVVAEGLVEADLFEKRRELEAVLSSGLFARSASLALILRYICERHFSGHDGEIKEYNIAVEALGRPPSFDQTRDSIVRVEAYRLRKRLQQYYRQEGAGRELRIFIPPGGYVPQFQREPLVEPAPEPRAELAPLPAVALPPTASKKQRPLLWIAAVAIAAAAIAARDWPAAPSPRSSAAASGSAAFAIPAAPLSGEVRILVGNPSGRLLDSHGKTWQGDNYFTGGEARAVDTRTIAFTDDPAIYLHRRRGIFRYDIPLKSGSYEMHLHFAETFFGEGNNGGGEASRIFHVAANGRRILENFDVLSDAAGGNAADIKVFRDVSAAPDGLLHLEFSAVHDVPFLNGIELLPAAPGSILPIRVLARDAPYNDAAGNVWSSDRFFRNGVTTRRSTQGVAAADEALYQGERYGNFVYAFPVAPEAYYTATLRFCEAYFGPGMPGKGGKDSRVFDIYLNGKTLLSGFDIFREVGPQRELVKTFRGLRPNAQGKLIFSFVPKRNYALVNAIEIVPEI